MSRYARLTYCTVGAGGKYMLSLLGSRVGLLRIEVGQSSKLKHSKKSVYWI